MTTTTMRNVYLHGALGKEFGRKYQFDVATVAEAIQALAANFPTFVNRIRNGFFRVVAGKSATAGMDLSEDMLPAFKLGQQDLHIVPVVKGSKRGGLGKVIAGIALIGLSAMTGGAGGLLAGQVFGSSMTYASMTGSIGASMLLTGVSTMIAPETRAEETRQSFTMTGPQVVTREGGIIPIAYGEVITGGTMISGALNIQREDR